MPKSIEEKITLYIVLFFSSSNIINSYNLLGDVMLKKMSLRKISIATLALFTMTLIYFMPESNSQLKYTIKDEDIEYVYNNTKSVVYLLDSNNYIARTNIPGSEKDIITQAKKVISSLIIDGDTTEDLPNGFRAIIPSGTEIKDISLKDKILTINFSKELLDINKKYEEKMLEAIIYTLTSIDGVEKIILQVEGTILKQLPNSKKDIPTILTKKYGINKEYDINEVHNIDSYTVYYVSKYNDTKYYVPITKYINNKNNDKVKVIIDELSASPIYESNLMSYLNANTTLINYEEKNDILELNFNEDILDTKSSNKILEEVIYTISLSLEDNYTNLKEVNFLVNNKQIYKNSLKSIE